jgi:hypothetical protein
MKKQLLLGKCFVWLQLIAALNAQALQFEVSLATNLASSPQSGRLLVLLCTKEDPQPRFQLGNAGKDAPYVFGMDTTNLSPSNSWVVDEHSAAFPVASLQDLPEGDYFAQTILMCNPDNRMPHAPGNFFSQSIKLHLSGKSSVTNVLTLDHRLPDEVIPPDTDLVKYLKFPSPLLSRFHGRPMFLRVGIILPRDYAKEPVKKYPLWIRIGGLDSRFTHVGSLMQEKSGFRNTWLADSTPRFIMLQLDGAGPLGDPYQVNSANNGPFGDAITQELIPSLEKMFRAQGTPRSRVLSGLSTGGWASLALQIFYPDFFNGTWSSCPDGIDFRALELINIYEDDNAFVNKYGFERPGDRAVNGDVRVIVRREVALENVMGTGSSWTMSGGQWCDWNAVYGPRGADGRPVPLWDPATGKIDRSVADQWKKYDLRLICQQNWKTLGPKLRGKLHLSVGDSDNFFLNNAVHLMDEFLQHADPPYEGRVVYGPQKGHGWSDVDLLQMLKEMEKATSMNQ